MDEKELQKGIKVEKEHTGVYEFLKKHMEKNNVECPLTVDEFAEWIAKDHLKELKDYYTRLEKMENEEDPTMEKSFKLGPTLSDLY